MPFPDGNPGAWPIDPTTAVGRFRLAYGDVYAEPYTPNEPGYRNFDELSDAEIEAFLEAGNGSINRAIGYYYLQLAGTAAKAAKSVKDYDLQVDTTKRGAEFRALAKEWFDLADGEDSADAFEIVPTGTGHGSFIPEGTIPQWGRRYTWSTWR